MSEHTTPSVERHCDVVIIGGAAAGVAAALHLIRQRWSVIVVDAGEARDAPVAHRHGYVGREGSSPSDLTSMNREEVRRYGGEILDGRANRVTHMSDDRFRVELAGGHCVVARRVLVATGLADDLPTVEGLGEHWETDLTGATAVSGVYVVGNVAEPSRQPLQAAADGSRVGVMVGLGLADDDIRAPARPSANEADWDHRYGGEQLWSGNPNGTLVHELKGLAPGRALDVGAGEGGDALWLAARGWSVTASDISGRALERIGAEAERRSLRVECQHMDATAFEAFEAESFDLVSAQYASIPRTPDRRGERNLLRAVALGGTLLVVSHDLAPLRAAIDTTMHSRAFDPDAYVRVDDIVAAIGDSAGWDILVHEKRRRLAGAASSSHHVDDVVLRAERHVS